MAEYRAVHIKMWTEDNWFQDQDMSHRYVFIYLFTNSHTSASGIYEIPFRVMQFETGIQPDTLRSIMSDFEKDKKVFYSDGVVWVVNMRKYQETSSPKLQARISSDIASVPSGKIKTAYAEHYGYRINTVPIPYIENESDSIGIGIGIGIEDGENGQKTAPPPAAISSASSRAEWGQAIHTNKAQTILLQVAKTAAIPTTEISKIDVVHSMLLAHGEQETIDALVQARAKWVNTQGKNGRTYSPINFGWVDWALGIVSGEGLGSKPAPIEDDPFFSFNLAMSKKDKS